MGASLRQMYSQFHQTRGLTPCRGTQTRLRGQRIPALTSQVGCLEPTGDGESLPFPFPCARSTHRTGISRQDTPRDSTKFNPTAGVRWMPKQAPFGSACPLKKIPQFPSTSEGALPPLWRELPWAGSHAGDSALMMCTVASRHFPSPHVPTLRLQEGSHEADCAPHPTTPPSPVQAFCRFGPRHWQPEPAHLSALLRRRMNITFAKQIFSHLSLSKAQARQACAHLLLPLSCFRRLLLPGGFGASLQIPPFRESIRSNSNLLQFCTPHD